MKNYSIGGITSLILLTCAAGMTAHADNRESPRGGGGKGFGGGGGGGGKVVTGIKVAPRPPVSRPPTVGFRPIGVVKPPVRPPVGIKPIGVVVKPPVGIKPTGIVRPPRPPVGLPPRPIGVVRPPTTPKPPIIVGIARPPVKPPVIGIVRPPTRPPVIGIVKPPPVKPPVIGIVRPPTRPPVIGIIKPPVKPPVIGIVLPPKPPKPPVIGIVVPPKPKPPHWPPPHHPPHHPHWPPHHPHHPHHPGKPCWPHVPPIIIGQPQPPVIITEPYPIQVPVPVEATVYNLQCALPKDAKMQDVFAVNVNLMATGEDNFQVLGVFGLADESEQELSAEAVGSLEETINLKLPEGDYIFLERNKDENGMMYYEGNISLLGRRDDRNLACMLSVVKQKSSSTNVRRPSHCEGLLSFRGAHARHCEEGSDEAI